MADDPSYYELLGVAPSASRAEITAAYKQLARSAHPDTGGNAGLFRLIKAAHDTLADPERRGHYDRSIGLDNGLDGLSDPLELLTLAQDETELGNVTRARAAFQAVIASGDAEWLPLAWLGLAGVERDDQDFSAARRAYLAALETNDPDVVAGAMVGIGDVERDLGRVDAARLAYQQAIGTGDDAMIAIALLSLGELEAEQGNLVAARAAFQLAIRAGDEEGTAARRGDSG
jgi:tetratricopeptide (TPR) repeat protein